MSQDDFIVLKLHLEPDAIVSDLLDGQSRICNWLYNHLLEHALELREEFIQTKDFEKAKILYSQRGLRNRIPEMKQGHPFLKVVYAAPLKNTALRLSEAIQSHQKSKKGKRKGRVINFPKFSSWKQNWFSLYYDEPNKGYRVEQDQLILSLGMGEDRKRRILTIPLKEAHCLHGKTIRNLRIVKEMGLFYAIFTIKKVRPVTKKIQRMIALDPNHKNFSYGIDNEKQAIEISAPYWVKNFDKRIDELKTKRDRKKKKSKQMDVVDHQGKLIGKSYWEPSRQWKRYNDALEKVLRKRRDQTKTFLYTLANSLYDQYDCVGIGDYTPHGEEINPQMRRAMSNRSLIGRFKKILLWVAKRSGKTFIEFKEEMTTRTCHDCGHVVKGGIAPSVREWKCPTCNVNHIRDENAAKNGMRRVLDEIKKDERELSSVSCSDLFSVEERWIWRVLPSGIHKISRGQNGGFHERQGIKLKASELSA